MIHFKKIILIKLVPNQILFLPKGLAHGFLTLSDNAEVIYFASESYNKDYEESIIWKDVDLKIKWPINKPILSKRDRSSKYL